MHNQPHQQQPYEASPSTRRIRIDIPDARILITVDDTRTSAAVTITSSGDAIEPEITEIDDVLTVTTTRQQLRTTSTTITNNFGGPVGTVITAGNVSNLSLGGGKITMEGVSGPPPAPAGSTVELVVPSGCSVTVRPDNIVTTAPGAAATSVTIQRT
jgi:hypothetical protein